MKKRLRAMLLPLLLIGLTAYFGVNAIRGSRGLRAQAADRTMLAGTQARLAEVNAERDFWQTRVDGLRDSAIEADMLGQRAREVLNLADPDDLVLPLHRSALSATNVSH